MKHGVGGAGKGAAWTHADHIENWLAGGTGTSVATMANFTMRRLSTLGSGDSDSILWAHERESRVWPMQACTRDLLDVHRLVSLEERECGRARKRLLYVPDNVVASKHSVLRERAEKQR